MPRTESVDVSVDEADVELNHNKLVAERETLYANVQALFDKSGTLTDKNVSSFAASYDRLNRIETKLENLSERVRCFNASVPEVSKSWKLEVTQYYCSIVELIDIARSNYINLRKANIVTREPAGTVPNTSSSHLPRISLPSFSGKIEEWTAFHSLFISLVDSDPSLAGEDVKKLQYLRSCLKGDAQSVIASFPLTAESYPLALAALVARYQNRRRLASHFMNRILEFKPLHNPSYADLQNFLNVHENNWISLSKLENLDLLDFVKLHISLGHLDPGTRRAFEEEYTSSTIPSHRNLIDFVTEMSRREELLKPIIPIRSSRSKDPEPTSSSSSSTFQKKSDRIPVYQVSHKESISNVNTKPVKSIPQNSDPSNSCPKSVISKDSNVTSQPQLVCWNCGADSHIYGVCPKPRRRFCYRCGYAGVTVRTCPSCTSENDNGSRS